MNSDGAKMPPAPPELGRQRIRRKRVELLGAQHRQVPKAPFFALVCQIVVQLAAGDDHTGNRLAVGVAVFLQQRMEFVVREFAQRRVRRANGV